MKLSNALRLIIALLIMVTSPSYMPAAKQKAQVQVALILDTSGSMSGLINQARTQLWKIINELATSSYEGRTPELRIALYEYGNSDLSAAQGYIRQVSALSNDLDMISERLFRLSTNGGDEYCGQVIQVATDNLEWSANKNDLKLIFIAGNEAFTQGPIDYKASCKAAISKGIIVNTIHCGDYQTGVSQSWKDGADLADGKYMNIDHNLAVVHIDTPYDGKLDSLNRALNGTYLGYGAQAAVYRDRQIRQDANAEAAGSATIAQRASAKASGLYSNSAWDLVDATADGTVDIKKLDTSALPAELRHMDSAELEKHVEAKRSERKQLQEAIMNTSTARERFIAEQRQEQQQPTLDQAMINAIREQAGARNFRFR